MARATTQRKTRCCRECGLIEQLPVDAHTNPNLEQYEEIARAMSRWSTGLKPWETRHPKSQRHWLLVAEAVMSNDTAITDPILERVRARKAELDAR